MRAATIFYHYTPILMMGFPTARSLCSFLTEDGGETNNRFIRNLGASTIRVKTLTRPDETDDTASTYWMTNGNNTWEDNVAAGSFDAGFWMELKTAVRPPTRAFLPANYNPAKVPLHRFINNVAHSNRLRGWQDYPGLHRQPAPLDASDPAKIGARLVNLKAYRNGAGL